MIPWMGPILHWYLGINAARLGMESKIFYSFMGLNMVLKGGAERAKFIPPGVMGAIPGMSTIATGMMKKKIDKANIPNLDEMQEMAQLEGVQLIACKMTVDMMEIDEEKLIEGVIVWTAEDFSEICQRMQNLSLYLKRAWGAAGSRIFFSPEACPFLF